MRSKNKNHCNAEDDVVENAKLTVMGWDPNIIQPLSTSVTVDVNGWAYVPVKALGAGVSPLLVRDVIGDAGVGTVSTILPAVSSSSSVSEGATYDPSSQPKFTFNIGYPSRDPVDVSWSPKLVPAGCINFRSGKDQEADEEAIHGRADCWIPSAG